MTTGPLARLVGLVGVPDLTPPSPTDPEIHPDWPRLVDLAASQRVLPSLWLGARATGLLEPLPESLRLHLARTGAGPGHHVAAVLEQAWLDNLRRNADLLDQLDEVVRLLADAGIEPIVLKGGQVLVEARWPDPGARVLTDLDLLIAPDEATEADRLLRRAGYRSDPVRPKPGMHHLPALRHPDRFGSIELHLEPISIGWSEALPAAELTATARPLHWRSLALAVPDAGAAITLALVHGWLADEHRFLGTAPVRATLDALRFAAGADEVDWHLVGRRLERIGQAVILDRHTLLAERWFGVAVPHRPSTSPASLDRWFRRLEAGAAEAPRPMSTLWGRALRVPHAFDARRLRHYYGDGDAWSLRRRRVAEALSTARPSGDRSSRHQVGDVS